MFNSQDLIKKVWTIKGLITFGVAIVMGSIIFLSITTQREHIRERMTSFGQDMKSLAYAGIKHPMAVGDSPAIEQQLFAIGAELENTEIVICDFNQEIIFATHKRFIGLKVEDFTENKATLRALQNLLESAVPPSMSYFEDVEDGKKYLVTIHSIYNEKECHHCHGSSRRILGGLLTRQSTDATYAAIATLRNRTIIISMLGLAALIGLIYFLLARMVNKPVIELADKAELLAQGDLSVSVPVRSNDPIGVLGNTFNYMVRSIKDQIEYANSLKIAIADPLIIVNTEMIITFMNEACANLTGFSREETEYKLTCRDIFKSEICRLEICDTSCPIKHCLVKGRPTEGIRTTIFDRASKPIPIMASASALKDAHGVIIGAVEIFRDITVVLEAERLSYIQKTAAREEEQRKYLENRAENLLKTLSEASEGNLTVRAEDADSNEVMGKIAVCTNKMLDNLEKMYEKISTFSRELEHEVNRRTLLLRGRTLMLERANRELRELDRLKSSFLANMSHELRTPMNSIIGYTDLLIDRVDGEVNEEQEKSLIKIENNAKHLLQLINDILDMSKIESGKIELDIRETDLKELIGSIATFFQPAIKAKNLTMEFDFADDLSTVFVDEDKVRQIFNNLLSNAVKFTREGGITIHAKPSTQGINPGEEPIFIEVCVEDTGIGIKEEDIGKLFDKFSQINVSTSRETEGTGLGLSIARGLVVLHKGVIWAESEFGKGTRLYFTLPCQEKIMEKSSKPLIEFCMADTLAEYFETPVEVFLKKPTFAGKPIRCWEYTHCGQTSCPAYGNRETRCWLIAGVHCKGVQVTKCPEKADYCKDCEIIENLVISEHLSREMDEASPDQKEREVTKTLLAIDDNPEVIELIRKNVGSDYNVIGLLDGEQAVAKAKEVKPTAITLDIMMPGKDGWQVLQELKRDPETEDIPVIVLSIVDEKKMGFSLGATEYIVKPINKNVLLHKLKNLQKLATIKNILIVDNESGTVDRIGTMLQEEGYAITKAYSNREAIEAIDRSKPDLIVLNLIMPDTNGFDVIEYIKSEDGIKNVPLIFITDKDLSEDDVHELQGRIQLTLNKGILSEDDLLSELKNTIKKM